MSLLKITAVMWGRLGNKPPKLDSLLEAILCRHHGKTDPGRKLARGLPPPPQGEIPIPIKRQWLGPWLVGRCSDPILGPVASDGHDHVCKRVEAGNAGLLEPSARIKMPVANSWTKSYRFPLRVRVVDRIVWFAEGDRRSVRKTLKQCRWLGKKTAIGYGRVAEWIVEEVEEDMCWFAATNDGPLLMRNLPVGPWLPDGLVGARPDFIACSTPYWHPERFTEAVVPC